MTALIYMASFLAISIGIPWAGGLLAAAGVPLPVIFFVGAFIAIAFSWHCGVRLVYGRKW